MSKKPQQTKKNPVTGEDVLSHDDDPPDDLHDESAVRAAEVAAEKRAARRVVEKKEASEANEASEATTDYIVVFTVSHLGKAYEPGKKLALTEAQAKPLKEAGAVKAV